MYPVCLSGYCFLFPTALKRECGGWMGALISLAIALVLTGTSRLKQMQLVIHRDTVNYLIFSFLPC